MIVHIDYNSKIKSQTRYIKKRIYKDLSIHTFHDTTSASDWADVTSSNSPGTAFTSFHNHLLNIIMKVSLV
jgi:hypothetical protein